MTDTETMMRYWRASLTAALNELPKEPFAGSREVLCQRIDNYRRWIAQAEGRTDCGGAV